MKYANYVYLGMVLLWAGVAAFFYFNPQNDDQAGFGDIRVIIAIMLSAYCLIRWWSRQMLHKAPRGGEDASWKRPPVRRASDDRERNPDFIFDDPPPDKSEESPK